MRTVLFRLACLAFSILLVGLPIASFSQPSRQKDAVDYNGSLPFLTDGSLGNGACFRVAGKVDAPGFFENLKRMRGIPGAPFHRGGETVTHFPEKLFLSYVIRDYPCDPGYRQEGTRTYLTREMMRGIQLSLYWKSGVDLRPIKDSKEISSSVEAIVPYAKALARELPKRFEWSWELEVPSAGVPLTDSLVLIFRTLDGRIAARVAARL
jgi:hypothetical protein